MNNFIFKNIIYFLILFCSTGSIAQSDWHKFTPPGQFFEVTVPGEMRNGEKKVLTDLGAIHPVTWLHQSKEGDPNYLYLVSYVDYPEGTFSRDSTDLINELFAVSVETQVKDLGGEIVYQSDSPYGMYPGIIYRATYNKNDAVIKSRMILMNDRLYILQVYTISSKSLNPEMNRFLESFKARQ